jgi:hypothetical protein
MRIYASSIRISIISIIINTNSIINDKNLNTNNNNNNNNNTNNKMDNHIRFY